MKSSPHCCRQTIVNRRGHIGVALFAAIGALIAFNQPVSAADLYARGSWPALASDRMAEHVGDSLTVIVNETSAASDSTQVASSKNTHIGGSITAGTTFNKSGDLTLGGAYDGTGQTGRSGSMVAEISVVVDEVLPNGDLRISGERLLNINGDRANIKLKGRVRRADISGNNTVLSNQIADVSIEYNGNGFTSRSAKPGIVTKIFSWLGLV
jgi:flagellar L-ring protein precursor FlgH